MAAGAVGPGVGAGRRWLDPEAGGLQAWLGPDVPPASLCLALLSPGGFTLQWPLPIVEGASLLLPWGEGLLFPTGPQSSSCWPDSEPSLSSNWLGPLSPSLSSGPHKDGEG